MLDNANDIREIVGIFTLDRMVDYKYNADACSLLNLDRLHRYIDYITLHKEESLGI